MADTPDIRFKGFTNSWEQCKLGEIGQTYTGLSGKTKKDFGHGDARFVTYMNVFTNPIADKEKVEPIEIDNSQNQVQYGDVFFTTSSETPEEVGMSCVWLENTNNIYLNSFCFGYRPNIDIDPHFMAYVLRSYVVRKKIIFLAQGISRYNISKNKVMEIVIPLPNLEEQKQLGRYFENLNHLIALHQRKCDEMLELKKYMLQKMFLKKGEQFPEIRFSGFTEPWKRRKLIDVCDYVDYRGKTPTKADTGIFLVTAKNVKNGYIDYEVSKEYISEDDYKEVMHRGKPLIGDVLITTEAPCGNVAQVNKENIALAQRIIKYRGHSNVVDNTYLKHYLLSPVFQGVLNVKSSGGTVRGIKGSILHQQTIQYPLYEEQLKIGQYLDKLEYLITLHQRKHDELKELKKYMLQNMFPKKG